MSLQVEDLDVELQIPARAEFVGLVRLLIASLAASRRELAEERIDDLKLAVSEAVTNAVESYGPNSGDKRVVITWQEDAERLEIGIEDEGGGFDPTKLAKHPPVTDVERLNFERGLGIPLIKTLVDQVIFESTDAGTKVRMVLFCGPSEVTELDAEYMQDT